LDQGDVLSRDMPKASIIIKTSSRELKLKARADIRHTVWFEVTYHYTTVKHTTNCVIDAKWYQCRH
jgi:Meiotic cell cortex C-terminal pleckstrin homology